MKVGFIGYGNMGGALIKCAVKAGVLRKSDVIVTDHTAGSRKRAQRDGFKSTDLEGLLRSSSLIFLCVKPQGMKSLVADLRRLEKKISLKSRCFVSIAAGIRVKTLEESLGRGVSVFRVIPNTPALLNAGVSGACKGRNVSSAQARAVEKILRGVGDVVWIADAKMDALTAVSGSGPAYVFYVAEGLIQAARKFGFSVDEARRLVHRTFYGAGLMLEQRSESAEELRRKVTSPGGTTEAAIREMDSSRIKTLFEKALKRAERRSSELSRKISLT
jgi:pyrroline-5-carboxylate reductase